MKFYRAQRSVAGLGGGVKWYSWVTEVGIPAKAVYYMGGEDEKLMHYYVRFDGDKIANVYEGNAYNKMKTVQGFTLGDYESIDDIKLSPKAVIKRKENKKEVSQFQVIRELNALYKEGIITEEEFTLKKRAILGI